MEYFDTSVLVAYYCPEPQSAAADQAITRLPAPCLSKLSEVEFASALSLKVRIKQFDLSDAQRALAEFHKHLLGGYYNVLPLRDYRV